MLKMIKVVGTSEKGFSEAVESAVKILIDSGERLHFFNVIEQRGSVRENKLKEYQVVIEVALEK